VEVLLDVDKRSLIVATLALGVEGREEAFMSLAPEGNASPGPLLSVLTYRMQDQAPSMWVFYRNFMQ